METRNMRNNLGKDLSSVMATQPIHPQIRNQHTTACEQATQPACHQSTEVSPSPIQTSQRQLRGTGWVLDQSKHHNTQNIWLAAGHCRCCAAKTKTSATCAAPQQRTPLQATAKAHKQPTQVCHPLRCTVFAKQRPSIEGCIALITDSMHVCKTGRFPNKATAPSRAAQLQ